MQRQIVAIGLAAGLAMCVAAGCREGGTAPSTEHSPDGKASPPIIADPDAASAGKTSTPTTGEIDAVATAAVDNNSSSKPKRRSELTVLSEQEPVEQHFPDGSLKGRWHLRLYVTYNQALPLYQQEAGSFEFNGPYEEYYPGGAQLFIKGNYVDGVRVGEWLFWHPNGAKAKAGRYDDGKLQGQWNVWREEGTLLRTESYQDNEKHGQWISYAIDGQTVDSRESFDHGQPVAE